MFSSPTVTVYNFRVLGTAPEGWTQPPYKATRRTIVGELHAEVLEGTAEEIHSDLLDDQGLYRRVATGWGELN